MSRGDAGAAGWRCRWIAGLLWMVTFAAATPAQAQLGALLSPGHLAKPHRELEGIANCTKCHEQGKKVTAAKCLACHKPVAERMARKMGVHRSVTTECVTCHAEHAGVDGELRPFDQSGFDHAKVALFPLDGRHAPIAKQCAACHKTRSFLTASPACSTCHADVHKGTLGRRCESCHSARTPFKNLSGAFDHSKSRFPLTGGHARAACDSCHKNKVFRGLQFASCSDCHRDTHRGTFSPSCTTCHTTATWRTSKVDHDRTAFKLVGRHVTVKCALCHKRPATQVKPKSDTCASCHVDVHRGAFRKDCKSCHSETGFAKAPFDHTATAFALDGRHAAVTCAACHKGLVITGLPIAKRVADFRGLASTCVSCHADVHRAELGTTCQSCHSTTSFRVTSFTHRGPAAFYQGQHARVACAACHTTTGRFSLTGVQPSPAMPARTGPARTPARAGARQGAAAVPSAPATAPAPWLAATFKNTPVACASCHKDVHLGHVGTSCERCHDISTAKFAVTNFPHASTGFTLTGRHEPAPCAACHKSETGAFPAGQGKAVRFKGVARECQGCHSDVHLGQFATACQTCHDTSTFKLAAYRHERAEWRRAFVGRHVKAACAACHKPASGAFPGGRGTAVLFRVEPRCTACHEDVHGGALGINCLDCHRP